MLVETDIVPCGDHKLLRAGYKGIAATSRTGGTLCGSKDFCHCQTAAMRENYLLGCLEKFQGQVALSLQVDPCI